MEREKVTDQLDYLHIAWSFSLTIIIVKRDPSNSYWSMSLHYGISWVQSSHMDFCHYITCNLLVSVTKQMHSGSLETLQKDFRKRTLYCTEHKT